MTREEFEEIGTSKTRALKDLEYPFYFIRELQKLYTFIFFWEDR